MHKLEPWIKELRQEVYSEMEKDRKARSRLQKRQQKFEDENVSNSKSENMMTYPLQIAYYEPCNLAIFGLVTREIQIHELMNSAGKSKFIHV